VDPTTLTPPESRAATGAYTIGGVVRDAAGNESAPARMDVRVDADPPAVALVCPTVSLLVGQAATATVSASDGQSGLRRDPSGTLALDTRTPGAARASIEATDNVGHSATASCSYTVVERATPARIGALLLQYVRESARYRALPRARQRAVDAIVTVAGAVIERLTPRLSPAQKARAVEKARDAVDDIAADGWLTATQAATLKAMISAV
jgi:hypothetical protein